MIRTRQTIYCAALFIALAGSSMAQGGGKTANPETPQDEPCIDLSQATLAAHVTTLKSQVGSKSLLFSIEPFPATANAGVTTAVRPLLAADLLKMDTITRTVDGASIPMPILSRAIVRPHVTAASPAAPDPLGVFRPINNKSEAPQIVRLAASVGRLQVKVQNALGERWTGLGTAFVIAPGIIATSCHVVSPLVIQVGNEWKLNDIYNEKIAIEFGDSGELSPDHGYRITGLLKPPAEVGFDVVFLSVERMSINGRTPLPEQVPLSKEKPQAPASGNIQKFVLVGYPDIKRTIDPNSAYRTYANQAQFGKFVVPGGVTAVKACKAPLNIILDDASTTSGQSGSILIDRNKFNVIGVHSCCAIYTDSQTTPPPIARFPCGTLHDTYANQAISSWSILNEPSLAQVLAGHHDINKPSQPAKRSQLKWTR